MSCRSSGHFIAAALLAALAGCATGPAPLCDAQPVATIAARNQDAGVEDIVGLPRADNTTRLFFRDTCTGDCRKTGSGISYVDIGASVSPVPKAERFWRPPGNDVLFDPLGLALLRRSDGRNVLFAIDRVDGKRTKLWGVLLGADGSPGEVLWQIEHAALEGAHDLLAVEDGAGFVVYVSRYDMLGFFPWGRKVWQGIVRVDSDKNTALLADGLRGANGIADPVALRPKVLVADYWRNNLRVMGRDGESSPLLNEELGFHPDNLTLSRDGSHVLAAGQKNWLLAALNLLWSGLPSPAAVAAVSPGAQGGASSADPLWEGGARYGASVSVAVPIGNNRLALGHIARPEILIVQCREHPALR